MNTCLFLSFACDVAPPASEMAKLDDLLRTAPRLVKALLHSPASTCDPYVDDGPPPSLVLQLYFAELPALEAALAHGGHLSALLSPDEFPALAAADVGQQAMLVRKFAVPEPAFNSPGSPYSTYLVSYQGEAEDLNAWHAYYLESHAKLMAMFPDIRELEVYTRLDWVSRLPWSRLNFMQRNKVAFDSPVALDRALNSPVRHAMRACFKAFPRFTGPTRHYAMATRIVQQQRGLASKR
ncbi:MAG TPA: hypothetical protein VGJ20_46555 [Xanthobacteraceae bacterium]|jgi:hypothetical protein